MRFLLDGNLSPETAQFLRLLGFDAKSLIEEGLGRIEDPRVVELARKEKRILITFDLDFGELYYFASAKKFDVIILRLEDQRPENVERMLQSFLEQHRRLFRGSKKLVVISEAGIRVAD